MEAKGLQLTEKDVSVIVRYYYSKNTVEKDLVLVQQPYPVLQEKVLRRALKVGGKSLEDFSKKLKESLTDEVINFCLLDVLKSSQGGLLRRKCHIPIYIGCTLRKGKHTVHGLYLLVCCEFYGEEFLWESWGKMYLSKNRASEALEHLLTVSPLKNLHPRTLENI